MNKSIKLRLIVMNFLQFAIWGAYLTSMGSYLGRNGLGEHIPLFYAVQGIVSIFMPALVGIIADRFLPAQKVLSICHGIAGIFMTATGWYAMSSGSGVEFITLFSLYTISVAFFMPTIALSNSVAYTILENHQFDTIKEFPPIRVFGTVGFICSMLLVNFVSIDGIKFQDSYNQFFVSGIFGILLMIYSLTLENCPVKATKSQSFIEASGLKAFTLFKSKDMAIFFIFSMLLGVSLQITNGFANPFISHYQVTEYFNAWGSTNANALISISQISETLCILIIPFAMKKFGIKKVMLIAMFAWVLRFGFFGIGNPGPGVWLLILSMIVYGVAFDFFNISGSLYVNLKTDSGIRSSAQGLFMLMTNGIGATVGTLSAGAIVNRFTHYEEFVIEKATGVYTSASEFFASHGVTAETIDKALYKVESFAVGDWNTVWYIFAGYALVVAILFMILFKEPKENDIKAA